MWRNILVALSNAPAFCPIYRSIFNEDYWTSFVLIFVTLASFTSHLVENHKHGMPGIGFSKNISYFLNRLDVLGCFIVIFRLVYLYWIRYNLNLIFLYNDIIIFYCLPFTLTLLFISEYDKYNAKLQSLYLVTHILWHITVFLLMDYFLAKFIYYLF